MTGLAQRFTGVHQDYSVIARRLGITTNERLVDALIDRLRIGRASIVADIACGCAGDASMIARRTGATVVGVDLSVAMLARAPRSVRVVRADATSIPLRDASAHVAYSVNLIQLLSARVPLFAEVARILRPGGRFGLPITNRHQLRDRFLNRFFPGLLDTERSRYPAVHEVLRELRACGFASARCFRLDLGSFLVDDAYVERQRTGIVSGLSLLPRKSREDGLRHLGRFVDALRRSGRSYEVRWVRTLVVARR